MNSEVSENNSIDMQVPTFVNVVAASCILRCCGVILFDRVELVGVRSSAMTAIFFRSTHA